MYYTEWNGNVDQFIYDFCKAATFYRNATEIRDTDKNFVKIKEKKYKFKIRGMKFKYHQYPQIVHH